MADDEMSLRRFRQRAAELLDEFRPDRYVVSDTTEDLDDEEQENHEDTRWLDDLATALAPQLPDQQIKKLYARQVLGRMEADALRRGNKHLRAFFLEQQPQLGWLEQLNYPIQVVQRISRPGERVRVRRERVRLGAMTSHDLRAFAIEERRNAGRDFATRNETCEAAEYFADRLDQTASTTIDHWVRRSGEEAA